MVTWFPRAAERSGRLGLWLAACGLLLGSLAGPALAQAGPTAEQLKLWRSLTTEQRQKLIQRYRTFQGLPSDQQLQLRRAFQRWKGMNPARRRQLMERWQHYQNLPDDKKLEFQRRWRRWQAMKHKDRARYMERYRRFQQLPPDKKRAVIERYRLLDEPPPAEPFDRPGTSRGLPPSVRPRRLPRRLDRR